MQECDRVEQRFVEADGLEECSLSKVLPVLFTEYERDAMRSSLIEESAAYVQALHNLIRHTGLLMAYVIAFFFVLELFVMVFGLLFIKWEAIRINRRIRYQLPIDHMQFTVLGSQERRIDRAISEFERVATISPERARTEYPNDTSADRSCCEVVVGRCGDELF
eukprot:TRINITY_DN7138_c0_g1_i1.p1 TRINITY_DN7138_c0_g1~~TRINITY_DN7138_c0_g1_i1.p1  ORF type:complete len:175 (-),score=12.16 TRINITY_DN7138_c0_g1_i1:107-598(-)